MCVRINNLHHLNMALEGIQKKLGEILNIKIIVDGRDEHSDSGHGEGIHYMK